MTAMLLHSIVFSSRCALVQAEFLAAYGPDEVPSAEEDAEARS